MNFFKPFYLSVTDPKAIADLRGQKTIRTIVYVFLLSFIIFLPNAIHIFLEVDSAKKSVETFINDKDNHFEFKNGYLSSSLKNTVLYFDNESILVDASDNLEPKEAVREFDVSIGFLKDRFFLYQSDILQEIKYSDIGIKDLDHEDITSIINNFYWPLVGSTSIISYLIVASYTFFIITIIAFIASPVKNTMSKFLTFKEIWKMTAYALTMSVIFLAIMDALKITIEFRYAIKWFVTLIILYMSFKTIPSSRVIDQDDNSEEFDLDEFEDDRTK